MSYILDALRKSDQLRRRGAAPTLLLGQTTAAAPRRPALLAYGLLALVLLGAGIAIGWLRPWQTQPAAPAPVASMAKLPEPERGPAPAVPPGMAPKAEPELQAQNPVQVAPAFPAPAAAAAPAPALAPVHEAAGSKSERQSAPAKAVAVAPKKAQVPQPAPSASSSAAAVAPLTTVMAMAELPVAIQQDLPPMSISVHAYSGKAADRLVGINSRLLHEGDYVAPGLRLEQITPDGMILSYKGYNFRRGVH